MSTDNNVKKRKVADFVKDGMETDDIRKMVQEIMLYMTENKSRFATEEELEKNMKKTIEDIDFFEGRYPMLYNMVTKNKEFDYSSLEYFLNMRNKIIKNELTSEEASKEVGQVWFDKYYKNPEKK
jgi:hypothetical protein